MVHYITTDYLGTSYYVLDFANELPPAFPWGSAMFDCQIFSPTNKSSPAMKSLIFSLPYEQIDWVHTSEPDSEYWHDEVDKASVQRGVQAKVGDGKPMTAWFTDLLSPSEWEKCYNHGACPHFLFLFVEPKSSLAERVDVLRKKIEAR
jgi:hypothetical protein